MMMMMIMMTTQIHAAPRGLVLVKEILMVITDPDELIGEIGYYTASLEAALQHIVDQWQKQKEK